MARFNPEFFGLLGKPFLLRLLEGFANELTTEQIELPNVALEEKEYFRELAELAVSKKGLPGKLTDVLYGIVAMGNEDGKSRLIHAALGTDLLDGVTPDGHVRRLRPPVLPGSTGAFREEGSRNADSRT